MTPKEFKRLYRIITILLEQGIDELVPARYQPWPGRLARRSLFWLKKKQPDLSRGARIRLAFEALGPIFIKFGQMLSTRRDLLPPDIAEELAMLQDRVPPSAVRRPVSRSRRAWVAPSRRCSTISTRRRWHRPPSPRSIPVD